MKKQLILLTFITVSIFLFLELFLGFRVFLRGGLSYDSMMLSDWFINYEGGFVRRGLIGEIFLELFRIVPYSIINTIIAIYLGSLCTLLYILYHVFKKNGWSFFISIFPVCIFISFLGVRRDYIMLILCFIVFMLFKDFLYTKRISKIVLCNVISSAAIMMHEVYFFFTIPILIVLSYTKHKKANIKSIIFPILILLPSFVTMYLVCVYKGDMGIAQAIWESWTPYFTDYPLSEKIPQMGQAVEWLSYDTSYAIPFHINKFWLSSFLPGIPSLPVNLYVIACTYIIITRLNTINISFWPIQSIDSQKLGSILLLQFIFLMPMFGFLSCDFGRIIMYWTLSSLFAYHWFSKDIQFPFCLLNISYKIQSVIDKTKVVSNKWIYITILLTLPIGRVGGADFLSLFAFIPYGWRLSFWNNLLGYLSFVQ